MHTTLSAMSVFRCSTCETTRAYGAAAGKPIVTDPLIECRKCGHATRHTFIENRNMVMSYSRDNMGRLMDVSFA
jgi:DNA-directed RNA polymerase subunit RPC12/RpoP